MAVRLTGAGVEVLVTPNTTARLTGAGVEALTSAGIGDVRVTNVDVNAVGTFVGDARVTAINVSVAGTMARDARVTAINVSVLFKKTYPGEPRIIWMF